MRTRWFVAFLALVSTGPLAAQEFDSFFEEFDVVLHQLQINVVDRDGNHIPGLTKEDFQIRLDGNLQEIQTVEEIKLEAVVDKADASDGKIPEQAKRLFVFFFDMRFSNKRGVLRSQEAAQEFIMSEMLPTDLAAVFTYTQLSGVNMITNFTADPNHLLAAVDTLGLASAKNVLPGPAGYYLNSEISDVLAINGFDEQTGIITAPPGGNAQGQSSMAASAIEELMNRAKQAEKNNYEREVLSFLTSMEKFADGLAFIRGRKNLLWFSSGFDSSSLVGVSAKELRQNAENAMLGIYERVSSDQLGRGDVQSGTSRAIEALQASGTMIWAMDTSMVDSFAKDKTGLQTLNTFAADTGGRVYTNSNDFSKPLEEIKTLTNNYYLVSFYPETDTKRKVGKLKVKVDRPRTKVYTNKGLLLDPDFKRMTQIEKNIQLSEYMARDQVVQGIPISVDTFQFPGRKGLVKLGVGTDIRGDYFFAAGIKEKVRNIEVYTLAINEETNQTFDQSYFQFKVDPARLDQQVVETGLRYHANLFVKPGLYKIKVVTRDLENGKVGSYITRINVKHNVIDLVGPTMLTDEPWLFVRMPESMERQTKAGNLDFSYPYSMGARNLIPTNDQTLAEGKEARFFYLLNYREDSSNQTLPKIQLMFMDQNGEYIMIPPEAVKAETEFKNNDPHLTGVSGHPGYGQNPLERGPDLQTDGLFRTRGS